MDFEIRDVVDKATKERSWDFIIKDGVLKTIDHNKADFQRACVATYLQRGTVPQMPSLGNQWAELLTGQVMPQTVNAEVRNSITEMTGSMKYAPKYLIEDGHLMVNVVEV